MLDKHAASMNNRGVEQYDEPPLSLFSGDIDFINATKDFQFINQTLLDQTKEEIKRLATSSFTHRGESDSHKGMNDLLFSCQGSDLQEKSYEDMILNSQALIENEAKHNCRQLPARLNKTLHSEFAFFPNSYYSPVPFKITRYPQRRLPPQPDEVNIAYEQMYINDESEVKQEQ